MRQLVLACRSFSAKILSLFVAALLTLAISPVSFAYSQVLEDYHSPIFQDLRVPVYTWMPVNSSPKAIVIALHGGCLHGRAYRTLGQSLAARNYMLVSLDMRGYGAWYHEGFGSKDDRHFNYASSEVDVLLLVDQLSKSFPDTPVFLLGESLGANMAEILLADCPDLFAGAVMVNPYVRWRVLLHPYMPVTGLRSLVTPLSRQTIKPYLKNRLSEDLSQTQAQFQDPLSRNNQSLVELLQSLFFNIKGRRSVSHIRADKPVLFVVGKQDRLCNPKATEKQFEKMPNFDKTLFLLQGKGHLLVETTKIEPAVVEILDQWLDVHAK